MSNPRRLHTEMTEITMAGNTVATREDLEAKGMTYMGSITMAASAGYLTPRACAQTGVPITPEELERSTYFAMLADCHAELCIADQAGLRRRPCIPVFLHK